MTRRTKVLVKVALTAAILTATLWMVGIDRVGDAFSRLHGGAWALAVLMCVATHALATVKWRFFLRACGATLPWRAGLRCYGAGLFANLCLPTMVGGDVLRAALAMGETRKRTAVLLGSLIDRGADFVGLGLLAVAGFFLALRPVLAARGGGGEGGGAMPFLVALAAVLLGAAALVWVRRRVRLSGRLRRIALEALVALRRLRARAPAAFLGVLASALLQGLLMLANREIGRSIGMTTDLGVWLFVWPLAKLVAMLPISLGGIGVREAAFLGLARPFGVTDAMAVASSLAWQAVLVVLGLVGGATWLVLPMLGGGAPAKLAREAT